MHSFIHSSVEALGLVHTSIMGDVCWAFEQLSMCIAPGKRVDSGVVIAAMIMWVRAWLQLAGSDC